MIRTIFFIAFIFIYGLVLGQDKQNHIAEYKITYLLTYQQDSTDVASLKQEPMELLIGKKYSLFQSKYLAYNDSLVTALSEKYDDEPQRAVNLILSLRKKTKISYKIFKSPDATTVFDKIYSDEFVYPDNEVISWNLVEERKEIKGFLCQKATLTFGGRDYIAWFTNEIPVSDGPYKFSGLPGLILDIHDTEKQYTFEFIGLEKSDNKFYFDAKGIPETTKKGFFRGLNNFKADIINQMAQRGVTFDEDNAKKVRESVGKSRNNEIEIKY